MPFNITINYRNDFFGLFNLILKGISGESITLHIGKGFLDPGEVILLTSCIIRLKGNINVVTIGSIRNPAVEHYLRGISLIDFCDRNFQFPDTLESIPSYTAMPIRRVERETMNTYINSTQQYLEGLCPDKDLSMLNLGLSELINNVYDHAHSPIGAYVFCQYFPRLEEIGFCVGDLGVGIPEAVNTYMAAKSLPIMSQTDCLKWAVKENNTIGSFPYNAGKGLDNLSSFIHSTDSSWKLSTSGVVMNGFPSGKRYAANSIHNFVGTLVEVRIKVANLATKEEVDSFEW
ncbi:MAG TPA: hypothetical protein VFV37_05085 [Luteibaculaceae bacterium]|nr:hypothetical protein [Luteibaculaceae bacterium]